VKRLEALEIDALRTVWRQIFKSSPPASARKEFLIRILAYSAQEQTYKALSKSCDKALREFEQAKCLTDSSSEVSDRALRPGARLIREWGGTPHEVMVMDRGYAYRGSTYASLSEIARHITGARWSGPRFFGLKKSSNGAMAGEGA
jgi:4'-phosphopantetheinyl transferase EntD